MIVSPQPILVRHFFQLKYTNTDTLEGELQKVQVKFISEYLLKKQESTNTTYQDAFDE